MKKLLLTALFFLLMANPTYAWWDTEFTKRANITIDNSQNNNSFIGLQIPVNISYDSDMQSDFGDLRFTWYNSSDATETEIPYFIESKADNQWAYLWMKVKEVTGSSYETVYLYYSNATATTTGNPNTTFEFYDDFSTSFDYEKWNVTTKDAGCNNIVSDGLLNLTCIAPTPSYIEVYIESKAGQFAPYYTPMRAEWRMWANDTKMTSSVHNYNRWVNDTNAGVWNTFRFGSYTTYKARLVWYNNNTDVEHDLDINPYDGSWHTYEMLIRPDNATLLYDGSIPTDSNGTSSVNVPDDPDDWFDYAEFSVRVYDSNATLSYDYFKARKWAEPEPLYALGSEETYMPPTTTTTTLFPPKVTVPLVSPLIGLIMGAGALLFIARAFLSEMPSSPEDLIKTFLVIMIILSVLGFVLTIV